MAGGGRRPFTADEGSVEKSKASLSPEAREIEVDPRFAMGALG